MRLLVLLVGLALAAVSPALAEGTRAGLGPAVPQATGDPHPEGNAFMRRYHMTMMRHDRDLTMYDGIRPAESSLGQCFDCHAVRDDAGTPVTVADERHFCRVCHDFAAVRIDCFDCHRSTPPDFEEPELHAAGRVSVPAAGETDDAAVLQAYLDGLAGRKTEMRE